MSRGPQTRRQVKGRDAPGEPGEGLPSAQNAYPNRVTVLRIFGFRASSPSAARSSTTRFARLAGETNVPGQRCSWISAFETALGRRRMRSSRRAKALGERGTVRPRRTTSRESESNSQSPTPSRMKSALPSGHLTARPAASLLSDDVTPIGEVEEHQDHHDQDEARHPHESRIRDRFRALRLQSRQRGGRADDDRETQPENPAHRVLIHSMHFSSSSLIRSAEEAWCFQPCPGSTHSKRKSS